LGNGLILGPRLPAASRRNRFTLHESRFTFFPLAILRLFPYTILSATPRTNDKRVGARDGLFECGELEINAMDARFGKPRGRLDREVDPGIVGPQC